jgi:hypothetical protein
VKKLVLLVCLGFTGCIHQHKVYITPQCMTSISFKDAPCVAVSGTLALCDKVKVYYGCISLKPGAAPGKVKIDQ